MNEILEVLKPKKLILPKRYTPSHTTFSYENPKDNSVMADANRYTQTYTSGDVITNIRDSELTYECTINKDSSSHKWFNLHESDELKLFMKRVSPVIEVKNNELEIKGLKDQQFDCIVENIYADMEENEPDSEYQMLAPTDINVYDFIMNYLSENNYKKTMLQCLNMCDQETKILSSTQNNQFSSPKGDIHAQEDGWKRVTDK